MARFNPPQMSRPGGLEDLSQQVHQGFQQLGQIYNFGKRDYLFLEASVERPSGADPVPPFIDKPQDGMLTYYQGEMYLFTLGQWNWIPNARWVADSFQVAVYAHLLKDDTVGLDPIDPVVSPVTGMTDSFAPRGLITDPANGYIQIPFAGIYMLTVQAAITHNEQNQGRVMMVELYNTTDGAMLFDFPVGTGRNQAVTNIFLSERVEVPDTSEDDNLQVRLSGALSTYDVDEVQLSWGLHQISEWREPLPGEPGYVP